MKLIFFLTNKNLSIKIKSFYPCNAPREILIYSPGIHPKETVRGTWIIALFDVQKQVSHSRTIRHMYLSKI
jgi:hypothetical protein